MSQDSYLGRIATTIGLFLKDITLSEKAIEVFNLIRKTNLKSDNSKDILPLLNLYFSYAIKCEMKFSQLIEVFLGAGPRVEQDSIIFDTLD